MLPAAAWEMKIITHSKTETLLHSLKGIFSQVRNISLPCKIIFNKKSFRELQRFEINIAKMLLSELICILVFVAVSFENPATTVDFFLKRRLNRQILFICIPQCGV